MFSFILICGSILYSVFAVIIFVDLFRYLTSGIRALSLVDIVVKYLLGGQRAHSDNSGGHSM